MSPKVTHGYVAHLSRLPRGLDADLRRIAHAEGRSFAELERSWLAAMVTMYDGGEAAPGRLGQAPHA